MKVLITGGAGFIGSHLAKKLQQQKHRVTIFDLPNSITDPKLVIQTIKNKFDVIYHLAGISGTVDLDPRESFLVNVKGAINLLEAVRLYSPKTRIIFSNSRQEYGKPQYLPVDELHPTNPTNHYGVHKLTITLYAQLYSQLCNLDTVILRTSNVYEEVGPLEVRPLRQPSYNVVNHWLSQAEAKKDIIAFGDGSQLRDYLHIDDLVAALIQAGIIKKARGHIFNIGSGKGTSMLRMAQTIAKKFGVKVITKPWPKEWKQAETGSYVSDIKKAKKLLNWTPKISFDQAIK